MQELDGDAPAVLGLTQEDGALTALAHASYQGVRPQSLRIPGSQRPNLHAWNSPSLDLIAPNRTASPNGAGRPPVCGTPQTQEKLTRLSDPTV
ncbi:hypothetical protein GCM10010411_68910 [Actinomadura fulvescens]|uniref:Uncharacterized protein n=1 Tax=Actinomadura fulvescens TaxID=46160 RepID=A0ABP6CQ61_9ACTN